MTFLNQWLLIKHIPVVAFILFPYSAWMKEEGKEPGLHGVLLHVFLQLGCDPLRAGTVNSGIPSIFQWSLTGGSGGMVVTELMPNLQPLSGKDFQRIERQ